MSKAVENCRTSQQKATKLWLEQIMDMVDYSVAEEDNYREVLVAKARKAPQNTSRLKPVGYCYNCYEDVQGDMLFCDNRCADEYHYRNKLK